MTESVNGPDNWNTATLALRPAVAASANPTVDLFDDITYTVETAFGSSPFAPTPTWTDLTDYMLDPAVLIESGRASEFTETNPTGFVITFDNADRRFDPDNAAGPYYGNLVPHVPIRFRVRRDAVTRTLFTGFVQAWPQSYVKTVHSQVSVKALDILSMLSTFELPVGTLYALTVLNNDPSTFLALDGDSFSFDADLSGNGHDGFLAGLSPVDTPIPGEAGHKAKVVDSQGVGDFVVLQSGGETIDLIRSFECWVVVDALGLDASTPGLIEISARSANATIRVDLRATDIERFLRVAIDGVALGSVPNPVPLPTLGTLMHVVGVLDSTLSLFSVYLNGALIFTRDVSGVTFEGGTALGGVGIEVHNVANATFANLVAYEGSLSAAQILTHYHAGVSGGANQPLPERMELLAEFAGLVDAGLYDDSDLPVNTYLGYAQFSGTPLDAMQLLMRTEQGRMFVNGNGVLTPQGRFSDLVNIATNITSQGDFGDIADYTELPFVDVQPIAATKDLMKNLLRVNLSGTTVSVADADSRSRFGNLADSVDTALFDPSAATNLGLSLLRRYAQPSTRIEALVVNGRAAPDDLFPVLLHVAPGWRLSLTLRPQSVGSSIVRDVTVEGVRHAITRSGWETTLYLVPAQLSYTEAPWFIFGDATFGTFGTTNLLAY